MTTTSTAIDETELLQIALRDIERVQEFKPYASYSGVETRDDFKALLLADPAFASLGLANDKYVTARIGGNLITSLHRKIGDMYENMFTYLLGKAYKLTEEDLHYSVKVKINDRVQIRSTDGRIPSASFTDRIPTPWRGYTGVAFEVRSCYQIGDSKRIQADYDMALSLRGEGDLPIMLIFCKTSLKSPVVRLRKSWTLFEGDNTFGIIERITGFDLFAFMQRNHSELSGPIFRALNPI